MGRKTYECEIIGFGADWPYVGLDSFVVISNNDLKIQSQDTYMLADNLTDFVSNLKKKAGKKNLAYRRGQLVTAFINEGLLDKMIITVIPKIIGEGLPLFAGKPKETDWKLRSKII